MTKREVLTLIGHIVLILVLGAMGAWYEWQKFKFYTGVGR